MNRHIVDTPLLQDRRNLLGKAGKIHHHTGVHLYPLTLAQWFQPTKHTYQSQFFTLLRLVWSPETALSCQHTLSHLIEGTHHLLPLEFLQVSTDLCQYPFTPQTLSHEAQEDVAHHHRPICRVLIPGFHHAHNLGQRVQQVDATQLGWELEMRMQARQLLLRIVGWEPDMVSGMTLSSRKERGERGI